MDSLPGEIIIKIFDYFTPKELRRGPHDVCVRWRNLVRLKAHTIQSTMDLRQLADSTCHLISLEVTVHIDFINRLLYGLGRLCPQLIELTIYNCNPLRDNQIEFIGKQFKKLDHIDVFIASGFMEPYFISSMSNVKSIVVNNRLLKTHLTAIGEMCNNLECFNMYGNVQYFPVNELNCFLMYKGLNLCELTLRCSEVTEKTCSILSKCHNLHCLRLYSCWLLNVNGLMYLSKLYKLTTLHISGLKLINRSQLSNFICVSEMNLLELNLSSSVFNDDHSRLITLKFPNLEVLEVWKCNNLTENGVMYIVNNFKCLKTLDLSMRLSHETLFSIAITNVNFLRFRVDDDIRGAVDRLKNLTIIDCLARYKGKYFRGTGEGYHANLFYYSTNNKILSPIKSESEIKMDDMFDY